MLMWGVQVCVRIHRVMCYVVQYVCGFVFRFYASVLGLLSTWHTGHRCVATQPVTLKARPASVERNTRTAKRRRTRIQRRTANGDTANTHFRGSPGEDRSMHTRRHRTKTHKRTHPSSTPHTDCMGTQDSGGDRRGRGDLLRCQHVARRPCPHRTA